MRKASRAMDAEAGANSSHTPSDPLIDSGLVVCVHAVKIGRSRDGECRSAKRGSSGGTGTTSEDTTTM